MEVGEILKNLGLEGKESQIYLALLELGPSTVLMAAKKSGVKRPTAYVSLNNLERKGLVVKVLKSNKLLYMAEPPKKLLTETEYKLKELKAVIPQMELLTMQKEGKPKIMIYEGKDQLDRAYDNSFITDGEVLYMSTIKYSLDLFPKTIKKLKYLRGKYGFSTRELVDESEEGKKYKSENEATNRQIKFISKELLPFDIDIGIFGKRVLITSVRTEYFTVSLESEEISQAFKILFEVMWRVAK